MNVLVTGADGSVGRRLVPRLEQAGYTVAATDIDTLDVRDSYAVKAWMWDVEPEVVWHLAGAKHAPEGELHPWETAETNTAGTRNIVRHRPPFSRVVLSSTCKACNAQTAYGASKLIAERIVLNADGVVVRFHNIPESDGNVFRYWESLPPSEPIPYTDCWRRFTPITDAVDLLAAAAHLPSGRYAAEPSEPTHMRDMAARLYPGRRLVEIPRRRGDRDTEPLHDSCETWLRKGRWVRIESPYDPVKETVCTS